MHPKYKPQPSHRRLSLTGGTPQPPAIFPEAYKGKYAVTWNPFPPGNFGLKGPQISVIPAERAFGKNVEQLKDYAATGNEPAAIWLTLAICDSEEDANACRHCIDGMLTKQQGIA